MGTTFLREGRPFSWVREYQGREQYTGKKEEPEGIGKKQDGACRENCYGTYIHGIFDGEGMAQAVVGALLERKGLSREGAGTIDYKEYKEEQYNKLAGVLRSHIDMDRIYRIMEAGCKQVCARSET